MSLYTFTKRPDVDLNQLEYMVMCYVWEQEKMSLDAIKLMQRSMIAWNKFAQWNEDNDLFHVLGHLAKILKWADEGKYKARKELYKQNNVNWRKVFNIPGSRTIEDIMKAKETYEQYARENPEQEGLS